MQDEQKLYAFNALHVNKNFCLDIFSQDQCLRQNNLVTGFTRDSLCSSNEEQSL